MTRQARRTHDHRQQLADAIRDGAEHMAIAAAAGAELARGLLD